MRDSFPQNQLKSFKIGILVHPCTIGIFSLYAYYKCYVYWQKFDIARIECPPSLQKGNEQANF